MAADIDTGESFESAGDHLFSPISNLEILSLVIPAHAGIQTLSSARQRQFASAEKPDRPEMTNGYGFTYRNQKWFSTSAGAKVQIVQAVEAVQNMPDRSQRSVGVLARVNKSGQECPRSSFNGFETGPSAVCNNGYRAVYPEQQPKGFTHPTGLAISA
ncbi:MAG: hypothetical protein ACXWX7_18530 [Candidatus Binatia bacterium]